MMRVIKIGIGMVALGLSTAWLGVRPTPLLRGRAFHRLAGANVGHARQSEQRLQRLA